MNKMTKSVSKMMHKAFYRCSRNAELIERAKIEGVDQLTRMRMDMHFLMCKRCRKYRMHSDYIDYMIGARLTRQEEILAQNLDTRQLKKKIMAETVYKM